MPKASFRIVQNHQLLMIRPVGAWSAEKATEFVRQANQYLIRENAQFAGLVDLRQWGLGTPEAMTIINNNMKYAAGLGYQLEFHFGIPQAVPLQISKERITPTDIELIQTGDPDAVYQKCVERAYHCDHKALLQFFGRLTQ